MPEVTNKSSTILVTGSNGYIGTWIVRKLLERGFSVRAVVRSEQRGKHLLGSFSTYDDRLELAIVPDLAKEGAFDEVVKGVEGIVHTASPVVAISGHPDEIVKPAVGGVTAILHSALKHGTSSKRVVITSSMAAVEYQSDHPVTYTEKDWNVTTMAESDEKAENASSYAKYCASKVKSEQAVWEFVEKHKSEISWDVSVLNPPWVYGPPIHDVNKPSALNSSAKYWFDAVVKGELPATGSTDPLTSPGGGWIDVRDCAEAHVRALERVAAGGKRIFCAAGYPHVWQDFFDTANGLKPQPYEGSLAKGLPDGIKRVKNTLDSRLSKEVLGIEWCSMEELTRDTLEDFQRRGSEWIVNVSE
ncbi:D-lactaldehyde dehydrogenase [Coniophora puteana RWD-64-598 SS2]|uniref:D-lactaldehyde dehydrogenase n=1 Tax=Coniophora puteana (strain RWD-64-598) TaxID=741705 RepID=A0A5M3MYG4_CONPW|nr:D-lactaldehyde dehydrogenase [Coniophora puteana RWD-64-598 SS2]EIW83695.1 D-lactaldehyde dehydrogenase [Coniophora puteana RWD-64-598 SS2]